MSGSLRRLIFVTGATIIIGATAFAVGGRFVGAENGTSGTVDEAFMKLVCAPSPGVCSTEDLKNIRIRVEGDEADPAHLVNVVLNGRANVVATGQKIADEVIIRSAIADVVYRLAILHEAATLNLDVSTEDAIAEIEANNASLTDPSAGTLVPAPGFDVESMVRSSLEPEAVEAYRTGMIITRFIDEYVTPLGPDDPLEARRLWMADMTNKLEIQIDGYDVAIDELPEILATPLFPRP